VAWSAIVTSMPHATFSAWDCTSLLNEPDMAEDNQPLRWEHSSHIEDGYRGQPAAKYSITTAPGRDRHRLADRPWCSSSNTGLQPIL
jgi:hypothetical protein